MDTKTLERLAKQFDELAELITAISGTFRDAGEGGDGGAVDGKTAKPVRAGGKPAAKSASKKAAKEELTEDDVREAMEALTKAKGKDALIDALSHVGASRFSEVDEGDWPAFKERMDELMAEDDEVDEAPATKKPAAKKAAAKKAKPKAPDLEEDIQPKFSELVDADRNAAKKVLKKHGAAKLSDLEEDSYADFLADVEAALEEVGEDDDLTG
mgnify:CR=1 FL=1